MNEKTFKIMGQYKNQEPDELECDLDENDAEYLLGEHALAYKGTGYRVWIEEE